jgi:hypothetical protein
MLRHPDWSGAVIGYYDKDGKPIDFIQYARLMENGEYRRVALTDVGNGFFVSTVWFGLDYSYGGPPLVFETMVFHQLGETDPEFDDYQRRYSTLEEALKGHAETVELTRTKALGTGT